MIAVCLIGIVVALPNLFYGRVERANDARAAIAAGAAETPELAAAAAGWPAFLPSELVNLGLDLRGGAHVLVEVQLADAQADRLEGLWPELRDRLRDLRDEVGTVRRLDGPPKSCASASASPRAWRRRSTAVEQVSQPVFSITGAGAPRLRRPRRGRRTCWS